MNLSRSHLFRYDNAVRVYPVSIDERMPDMAFG
jgi:hypothetical protein